MRCRLTMQDARLGDKKVDTFGNCREERIVRNFDYFTTTLAYPLFLVSGAAVVFALHWLTAFLTENRKLHLENICCAVEVFLRVSGNSDCLRFLIYASLYDGWIAVAADVAFVLNDSF